MKKIICYSFISLVVNNLSGQSENFILVQNDPIRSNAINIKWYTPELIATNGVNIYRKEKNKDWEKINSKPVQFKDYIVPESALKANKDLAGYLDLSSKKENLKGLAFTVVLLKSFQSPELSKHLGIWFDDLNTIDGKRYTYKVCLIKSNSEIELGNSKEITAGNYTPIPPPKEVKYSKHKKQIEITWQPEPQRYFAINVFRKDSTSNSFQRINKEPILYSKTQDPNKKNLDSLVKYQDFQIKTGMTYTYYSEAIDFFGGQSKPSPQFTIIAADLQAPAAPHTIYSDIKGRKLIYHWQHVDRDKDLAGFHIYRTQKNDSDFIRINKSLISKTQFSFSDSIEIFSSYMYKISAVDNSNNESFSNPRLAEVFDNEAPAVPSNIKISADSGRTTLTWTKGKEKDLKGYIVYRSIDDPGADNFVKLNPLPIKEAFYEDKLPYNSKNRFFYKIVAIDASLNRSAYSIPVSIRLPDLSAPSPPLLTAINKTENGIQITWLANPEPDLKRYELFRKNWTDSAGNFNIVKLNISRESTTCVDKISQSGIQDYYLSAIDSTGLRSLPSNHLRIMIKKKSENENEQNIQLNAASNDKKNYVELVWKSKFSGDLLGYVVYRRTNSEYTFSPLSGAITEKYFTDSSINKGALYIYQLRAYTTDGEIYKSKEISVTIK